MTARFTARVLLFTVLVAFSACGCGTVNPGPGHSLGAGPASTTTTVAGQTTGPGAASTGRPIPPAMNSPAPAPRPAPVPTNVAGTITWPDGRPAARQRFEFFPQGYPYGGQSGGVRVTTDATGHYRLDQCPCSDLGGLFVLPPGGGDQWDNGGNQCLIMLSTRGGALTTTAAPGADLDWTMLDMPCARDYILPRLIKQEIADIESDPQQLSGGSWQTARARSS